MLTKKRRKVLCMLACIKLGKILHKRGVDTSNIETFSKKDFLRALILVGATKEELDELRAEIDAICGRPT